MPIARALLLSCLALPWCSPCLASPQPAAEAPKLNAAPGEIGLSARVLGAFLDAPSRITLATSAPLSQERLKKTAVAKRGNASAKVRIAGIAPSKLSGGDHALYDVELARPVAEGDVAGLEVLVPDAKPQTVFARDALMDERYTPLDAKLGVACGVASSTFATWSPVSESVQLLLYEGAQAREPTRAIELRRGKKGVWSAEVPGDLHGVRYRYRFNSYGKQRKAPDIHCAAATSDSAFSVVADLSRLKPKGWDAVAPPALKQPTDEVIYEVHVRDFSAADPSCPPELRGTYLGLAHENPAKDAAPSSGLSHLKDLGVSAVHLLPIQDFTAGPKEYNWGYWTALFNVPESNYASDARDPLRPIIELREAIEALHAAGIRVILDVAYNHTSSAGESSPLDQTVPAYFHRTAPDGSLLDDTGVGNSIADERPMTRKYILDSLEHWTRDYRVDGFRFDLLGTHKPETVRAICERLLPLRRDLSLYGEPWTGGGPAYFPKGAQKGLRMAVFNDDLRNAIRGDLDGTGTGFATGPGGDRLAVRLGVMGAIDDFASEPIETVNYVSAHDNLTLWDKLLKAQPRADDATRRSMQKLALGMVLTSQGIAFLHGGCDFARTKGGNRNSYNAGDEANKFDWARKAEYGDINAYVRGLIALRRAHPALRMAESRQVRRAIRFLEGDGPLAFTIDGSASGDAWSAILVAYNGEPYVQSLSLPAGDWTVVANAREAGTKPIGSESHACSMPAYSMLVAFQK